MGTQPVLLAVGADVPAKNLSEFVAMAKVKPGAVTYGSSGEGTAVRGRAHADLAGELEPYLVTAADA